VRGTVLSVSKAKSPWLECTPLPTAREYRKDAHWASVHSVPTASRSICHSIVQESLVWGPRSWWARRPLRNFVPLASDKFKSDHVDW
jgi:hypothetical protein